MATLPEYHVLTRVFYGLTILLISGISAHAATPGTEPWAPIARECSAQIGEQGGFWPQWTRCTVDRVWPGRFSSQDVERCIDQVEAERERIFECSHCGDPLGRAVHCLGVR